MNRPLFSNAAEIRLGEIADYTAEKWGEEQAERYLGKLMVFIEELPNHRSAWRSVRDKRMLGVYFVRSEHHFVFFEERQGNLVILSILHESMDLPTRLREDARRAP